MYEILTITPSLCRVIMENDLSQQRHFRAHIGDGSFFLLNHSGYASSVSCMCSFMLRIVFPMAENLRGQRSRVRGCCTHDLNER